MPQLHLYCFNEPTEACSGETCDESCWDSEGSISELIWFVCLVGKWYILLARYRIRLDWREMLLARLRFHSVWGLIDWPLWCHWSSFFFLWAPSVGSLSGTEALVSYCIEGSPGRHFSFPKLYWDHHFHWWRLRFVFLRSPKKPMAQSNRRGLSERDRTRAL